MDIHNVGKHNLDPVDIISGGFPCQDISIAGKGKGIEGARSGLWFEMFRVIGELRPRYAVIENVPMLIHRGLGRVLSDLASIGYDAEWMIISASQLRAWHKRKRIWIVAHPESMDGTWGPKTERRGALQRCVEFGGSLWGETPPTLDRMDDGLPFGMDRLASIGNAIVPQIAHIIGKRLVELG